MLRVGFQKCFLAGAGTRMWPRLPQKNCHVVHKWRAQSMRALFHWPRNSSTRTYHLHQWSHESAWCWHLAQALHLWRYYIAGSIVGAFSCCTTRPLILIDKARLTRMHHSKWYSPSAEFADRFDPCTRAHVVTRTASTHGGACCLGSWHLGLTNHSCICCLHMHSSITVTAKYRRSAKPIEQHHINCLCNDQSRIYPQNSDL